LEFEPTLSVDVAELAENRADPEENHADSEDEGEHVRDEDLMLGDENYASPEPFPPPLPSQATALGDSTGYIRHTINGGFEGPRRAVPPPLRPPPLSARPSEFRSNSALQSPAPTFGESAQESPVFGDRPRDPVTSVHRMSHSPRPAEPFTRNVEERPVHSERRNAPASHEPRLKPESTFRRGLEPAEYTRPGNSDRPLLERRRVARKDILREGDILLGKLRVERVITEGLLVTAEAVHLGLGTRAQIVLLSPHGRGFADAQEHFVRTARMVAQMQSEHVARVMEIGTLESGAPFLVTELQGYSDLAELLRVRGPFAVSDAVDYAIQITEAFAEAHSLGVIHGSLRPSSLRMSEGMDGWPLVKVLGFGAMAQWSLSSASVRPVSPRGSAANSALPYLSPEQIRSPGDLDTRTDIWSLGAILHEMLVGWPLYHADNTAALLAMIAADPPSPITTMRGDVPRQLESVILRCLQKDRSTRFATVADLARALQPYAPPESQATVDRIVRVMARGSTVPSVYSRPNSAMVHIRSHSPGPRSFESKTPLKQASTFRLGVVVGAVVVLGAAAGVTGAVFASQMLRSSGSGKTPEAERQASEPAKGPEPMVASVKSATPDIAAPVVNPVTTVAATSPVSPVVANPVVAREAPRPAIAVQRRQPVLASTLPPPHKEAQVDKTASSSPTKSADLFGDIK
jgi:serine/threonine-protein kinase